MSNVDHPKHYNFAPLEVITIIDRFNMNFYIGNIFKYVARHLHKSKPIEDLEKALWYAERYLEKFKRDKQKELDDPKSVEYTTREFDYKSNNYKDLQTDFLDFYEQETNGYDIIKHIFNLYDISYAFNKSLEYKGTINQIVIIVTISTLQEIVNLLKQEIRYIILEHIQERNDEIAKLYKKLQ